MTPEIVLLLVLLGIALVLFSFEWIPADVVALGLMLTLTLTGLLDPEEAFAGFGSDTVMMILGLLILTAALLRTGVVDMAGRAILRRGGTSPQRLLTLVVLAAAGLSAFISNTAAAAFFLPIVMGIAARAKVSPSKLLMPLAFASILTSSVTLISTSTNIVVSGLMTDYGLAPIGMFELAPVGVPVAVVGILYMLTIGRRMIPERTPPEGAADEFGLGPFLTEVLVRRDSKLVGKSLAESGLGRDLDLTVLRVLRESGRTLPPRAQTRLEPGDVLLVEGRREEILKLKDTSGLDIKADVTLADPTLHDQDARLVEAILLPRSPLLGSTLKASRFRERHGLQVLAVHRHGETLRRKLSELPLRLGDVLLVQGHRDAIAALESDGAFRVLGRISEQRPKLRHAPLAITIFVGSLVLATFKVVPLAVAVLAGALVAFVTRCLSPEEAYREVEWKVLILIGSMLALGAAMEETGAARWIAGEVVDFVGTADLRWLLAGFFGLTVLLTQPMSNQAAAVVVLPVAIQTALQLDVNPRTFAMTVAVAASCSYLTPLEPACLMVYGPGRYRFMDFFRVGALLTLLIAALAVLLVPVVWPP
ncbi:MAG TPA: SLC13 family permease [Gemmatimonadota bacterium]|jgi:di/tricarboxylate transporter